MGFDDENSSRRVQLFDTPPWCVVLLLFSFGLVAELHVATQQLSLSLSLSLSPPVVDRFSLFLLLLQS